MKILFRWFGKDDKIPLEYISQIPAVSGVVTALYNKPVGEVWSFSDIEQVKKQVSEYNLEMEVIESLPVHEDIKLGCKTRDELIANYCKSIENLAKVGVRVICYNFMPVFDWVRTDLEMRNTDGSASLAYEHEKLLNLDRQNLSLPGWDNSYKKEDLQALLGKYEKIDRQQLFNNLVYFLESIMPACKKNNVAMAIHPDDPPWDLFGLPRIITGESDIDKLFNTVPDELNGLTLCTGSLGSDVNNDIVKMVDKYTADSRVYFTHIRNIKWTGDHSFYETSHMTKSGDVDIAGVVQTLVKNSYNWYIRPDHGRNIFGEKGKPGYGLYDRALGAQYIAGLIEAFRKNNCIRRERVRWTYLKH